MSARKVRTGQSGMVLISAILLLLIITILAVSMFRSFGIQERIAGNVREKQRALHAAEAAQQYAEWWLSNVANITITATCSSVINANTNQAGIEICSNTFPTALDNQSPAVIPWTISSNPVGVDYTPPGMVVTGNSAPTPGSYWAPPMFYISALNTCATAVISSNPCYFQIDAVGYGGTNPTGNGSAAVAVIESTYEVQSTQGKCISCGG